MLPQMPLLTMCCCLLLPLHAAAAHALSVAVLVAADLSDALSHAVLIPLILMSPLTSSPSATKSLTTCQPTGATGSTLSA